jgi:hypothetical protein
MSSQVAVSVIIIALSALLVWILRVPSTQVNIPPETDESDIDYDALGAAESEVQDLDAFASPDDADEDLHDWGPGAPK